METKYYFIKYQWKYQHEGIWNPSNAVTDIHPIKWLRDCSENRMDSYILDFYEEITKELYDEINGWID